MTEGSTTTTTSTTTTASTTTTTTTSTTTTSSTTTTTKKPELEIPDVGLLDPIEDSIIKTSPNKLKPDRDDTFEAVLNSQPINIPSATNNAGSAPTSIEPIEPRIEPTGSQCGKLGGAAVLQAFGRAAHNLLPDLVFSWVTGGQSNKKSPSARLDDEDELEPRIIAGDVTSTVLFCWLVAIMEKSKDGNSDQFICTGALVEPDLVVTSASCTLR